MRLPERGKNAAALHSHAGLMQAMYFPSLHLAIVLRAGDLIVWDPHLLHGCTQDMKIVGEKDCNCKVRRFTHTAYTRCHTLSQ